MNSLGTNADNSTFGIIRLYEKRMELSTRRVQERTSKGSSVTHIGIIGNWELCQMWHNSLNVHLHFLILSMLTGLEHFI